MSDEPSPQSVDHGYKVVFLHGFTEDQVLRVMRGVKSIVDDPAKVAFCMSTKNNLEWKIGDLLNEVTLEHEYMKKNPPPAGKSGE